jgi:hypothetical protein
MNEKVKEVLLTIVFGLLIWIGISLITSGVTSGITAASIYWVLKFMQMREQ